MAGRPKIKDAIAIQPKEVTERFSSNTLISAATQWSATTELRNQYAPLVIQTEDANGNITGEDYTAHDVYHSVLQKMPVEFHTADQLVQVAAYATLTAALLADTRKLAVTRAVSKREDLASSIRTQMAQLTKLSNHFGVSASALRSYDNRAYNRAVVVTEHISEISNSANDASEDDLYA